MYCFTPKKAIRDAVILWMMVICLCCKKDQQLMPGSGFTEPPAVLKFVVLDIKENCKDIIGRPVVVLKCTEFPDEGMAMYYQRLTPDSVFHSTTAGIYNYQRVFKGDTLESVIYEKYIDWKEKPGCSNPGLLVSFIR